MSFFDILHLKSSNVVLVNRPKNYFEAKIFPFLASESGKRYSANVSDKNNIDPLIILLGCRYRPGLI